MATFRTLVLTLWVILIVALLATTLWHALIHRGEAILTAAGFLTAGVCVAVLRAIQHGRRATPLSRALAMLLCVIGGGWAFPIARSLYAGGMPEMGTADFARFAGSAYTTLCCGIGLLLLIADAIGRRDPKGW